MRQSKLLFYGKLAEKALQTYERDGWGEFPTQIVVERREIRPTADRGPILLCVDTSGMTSPALYLTVGSVHLHMGSEKYEQMCRNVTLSNNASGV